MVTWENLDTLDAFKKLTTLKDAVSVKEELSGDGAADRVSTYSVPMSNGLVYNYAAKQVDAKVIALLSELSREAQLTEKYAEVYNGSVVNTGEKRLVLHHLTRGQLGKDVNADGVNKRDFYKEQTAKIKAFADKVHSGEIVNAAGEKFTTVVQIGIGGSDLGPRAMYLALEQWAKANNAFNMEARFISNVDPDDAAAVLASTDVAHTIFILVSKSGTTLETLTNESFVKDYLKNKGLNPANHMIAVTSETSPLAHNSDYLAAFYMDDYIGGRYSSTSAVGGAVLSLAFTPEVFQKFLDGAAAEDKTALENDVTKNAALLDALIGVYERNVLGYPSTAVLPYSQALNRFPAHLQQLDMESNGKSVNRFGKEINYVTGPVIFGEPGDRDYGRCMVGDIDRSTRGYDCWVYDVRDCTGKIKEGAKLMGTNMNIRWLPDMTTQITDGNDIFGSHQGVINDAEKGAVLVPEGCATNNGTKGNPCLVADVFGDWRGELILRTKDNKAIRIYTNTDECFHKIFTLMHDTMYRTGIAWQNDCYNQPCYTKFYFAHDTNFKYVLPEMQLPKA